MVFAVEDRSLKVGLGFSGGSSDKKERRLRVNYKIPKISEITLSIFTVNLKKTVLLLGTLQIVDQWICQ